MIYIGLWLAAGGCIFNMINPLFSGMNCPYNCSYDYIYWFLPNVGGPIESKDWSILRSLCFLSFISYTNVSFLSLSMSRNFEESYLNRSLELLVFNSALCYEFSVFMIFLGSTITLVLETAAETSTEAAISVGVVSPIEFKCCCFESLTPEPVIDSLIKSRLDTLFISYRSPGVNSPLV